MLPNSFLNRFVKLHIREFSSEQKISYLRKHYQGLEEEAVQKLSTYLQLVAGSLSEPQLSQLELFCDSLLKGRCLRQAVRISFVRPYGVEGLPKLVQEALEKAFGYSKLPSRITLPEEGFLRQLPLLRNDFGVTSQSDL